MTGRLQANVVSLRQEQTKLCRRPKRQHAGRDA